MPIEMQWLYNLILQGRATALDITKYEILIGDVAAGRKTALDITAFERNLLGEEVLPEPVQRPPEGRLEGTPLPTTPGVISEPHRPVVRTRPRGGIPVPTTPGVISEPVRPTTLGRFFTQERTRTPSPGRRTRPWATSPPGGGFRSLRYTR